MVPEYVIRTVGDMPGAIPGRFDHGENQSGRPRAFLDFPAPQVQKGVDSHP
jgi:hypothetical protein